MSCDFKRVKVSYHKCRYVYIFLLLLQLYVLGFVTYSNSELISKIMNHYLTPLMEDQPDARPLPTQDGTTQQDKDKHPCLKPDSNPRSQ
jgi:hypothetical protein